MRNMTTFSLEIILLRKITLKFYNNYWKNESFIQHHLLPVCLEKPTTLFIIILMTLISNNANDISLFLLCFLDWKSFKVLSLRTFTNSEAVT